MDHYIRRVFEGESPCDKCELAIECQTYEKACRAFSFYVLNGFFEPHTARMPTHKLFNKIFKEDDKSLKTYLKNKAEKDNV